MPLYLISHAAPLSTAQQDTLAAAITKIHTELFTAPALFVNVRFSEASQHVGYVGGKKGQVNSINAHVRHGPSRTAEMYDKLCLGVSKAWADAVSGVISLPNLFLFKVNWVSVCPVVSPTAVGYREKMLMDMSRFLKIKISGSSSIKISSLGIRASSTLYNSRCIRMRFFCFSNAVRRTGFTNWSY